MDDIDRMVAAANDRLRKSRTGIVLELRGKNRMLYLRGTFPPHPKSRKIKPYQQRVALKMRADPATLKQAEGTAKLVGAELNLGRFDWSKWSDSDANCLDLQTVAHWLEKFEIDYWNRKERNSRTETTWYNDYRFAFKNLPGEASLTVELLTDTLIRQTKPNSRSRKRTSIAYVALARLAGLDPAPLRRLRGSYNSKEVTERDLPSDEQIIAWRDWFTIEYPQWRWIYGMLVVYGLRPHEIFHVANWTDFPILTIDNETKTGARTVVPLRPEWAAEWELDRVVMPKIKLIGDESNQALGSKISRAFHAREEIPFVAYDLRHCWARRSVEYELTPDVAAKFMGHTLKEHLETYRRWIGEGVYLDAYRKAIGRNGKR